MLNDFTGADKVYIACGYTDLRRGIDGLAGIVQQQFQLDPFTNTLFLFAADAGTESKCCTGRAMDFCCCTSAWSPAVFNGRAVKRKPNC